MKICAAQTKAVKGDVQKNIAHHLEFISRAVAANAAVIVFPELSLTGYEPAIANDLAIYVNDARLDVFREKADAHNMVISVGAPIQASGGVNIGMIVFQPRQPRFLYSKQFLHEDEYPFFVAGQGGPPIIVASKMIAFAICYELSIPAHAANALKNGANVYVASVAKTTAGMEKAYQTLSSIAAKYGVTTLIGNSVGLCDNFESAGGSAAWDKNGNLLLQLNPTEEGLLTVEVDN